MPSKIPYLRCTPKVAESPERIERQRFYKSPEFQALRRYKLTTEPVCECGQPATVAHHIVDIAVAPDRRLDPTNIQTCCARCHNTISSHRTHASK